MASDRSSRKAKDKWKEKKWYTIVSPSFFGEKEVATSPAYGPEYMVGRKVEVPISDITGNFRKASGKVILQVTKCEGLKCRSDFKGHVVSDDSIRRMVRRRKDRIDSYLRVVTADNIEMIVKTIIVADSKLTSTMRSDIRTFTDTFLTEKLKAMIFGDAANYLIGDSVSGDIASAIKHIYPIRKIEIRKSEVLGYSPSKGEETLSTEDEQLVDA